MNDALKNIFDHSSMEAIQKAAEIAPLPNNRVGDIIGYKRAPREIVEEKTAEPEAVKEETEVVYKEKMVFDENLKKEVDLLKEQLKHQTGVINRIIQSQNEMIKELNELQKTQKELLQQKTEQKKSSDIVEIGKEFEESKPKNTQQRSTGHDLNQEEYSVEKFFNFGKK
ncbi:MAG: hypothetical protein ACMXYK_00020 [Candidatus Woesearchaeota archaeon]